jgi:hypothetical protein
VDREESRFERLPVGPVSAFEFLLLGVLAAGLVLVVFPAVFDIESSCVGPGGTEPTEGDTYIGGLVVFGTLGWLAVFLGMLYASIAELRRAVVLLPLVWFAVFVVGAFLVAAVLGPEVCPS